MIDEHALEVRLPLTIQDIDYLVKKANRLGLSNREISCVYEKNDGDSVHIYFEAEDWNTHQKRGCA